MNCPTEHEEQAAVVCWFEFNYPHLAHLLVASANGAHLAGGAGQRAAKMNKMKKEGFKKGFPDLQLVHPNSRYSGLFIEMKRQKGGTASPEQRQYISDLSKQQRAANICKGADKAIEAIKAYMTNELCNSCWQENNSPECQGNHAAEAGYS